MKGCKGCMGDMGEGRKEKGERRREKGGGRGQLSAFFFNLLGVNVSVQFSSH